MPCTVALIVAGRRLLDEEICRDLACAPSSILTYCYPEMAVGIFVGCMADAAPAVVGSLVAAAGMAKIAVAAEAMAATTGDPAVFVAWTLEVI